MVAAAVAITIVVAVPLLAVSPTASAATPATASVPGAPSGVGAVAGPLSALVSWSLGGNGGSPITGSYIYTSPGSRRIWVPVGRTSYEVDGLEPGTAYTFTVTAANTVGESTPSSASPAVTPSGAGGALHPVDPTRILDTRDGTGGFSHPVGAGGQIDVAVAGRGSVPASGATAVVVNVTATDPTAPTYVTVWPTGAPRPLASNLNLVAGQTDPNLVEVPLGTGGKVSVYNQSGAVDVIFDVAAWVGDPNTAPNGGQFHSLAPARILDTRTVVGGHQAPLGAGVSMDVAAAGVGGVPVGAAAVVVNLTVADPTTSSYLSAWPTAQTRPLVSNINFVAGQVVPNRAIVKLGSGGKFSLYNFAGSTDVVIDVSGWISASGTADDLGAFYTGLTPARVLDTRSGTGGITGPIPANTPVNFEIAGRGGVPAANSPVPATAVVVNLTAVDAASASFVTAWPGGGAEPLASDINIVPGEPVPNLAVIKLGSDGSIDLAANGSLDLVIDVLGYYAGDVQISSETHVLGATEAAAITDLGSDHVTVSSATGTLAGVHIGDILVAPPTATTPVGFLRTVTAVAASAGSTTFSTVDANLDDAIVRGDVDLSTVAAEASPSGVTRPSVSSSDPFSGEFSGSAGATLSGSLSVSAGIDLKAQFGWGSSYVTVHGTASATLSASLSVTATVNGSMELDLPKISTPAVRFLVYGIPVVASFYARPVVTANADINGSLSTSWSDTVGVDAGVTLDGTGSHPFGGPSDSGPVYSTPTTQGTSIAAKATVDTYFGVDLYGGVGEAEIGPALFARLRTHSCNVTLSWGGQIDGSVSLGLSRLGLSFAKNWQGTIYTIGETDLGSATTPLCVQASAIGGGWVSLAWPDCGCGHPPAGPFVYLVCLNINGADNVSCLGPLGITPVSGEDNISLRLYPDLAGEVELGDHISFTVELLDTSQGNTTTWSSTSLPVVLS